MENEIKEILYALGADVCGIADIDRFSAAPPGFSPKDIFADCKSVVVFGKALPKGVMKTDPRFIYGHFNSFLCTEVDRAALEGAKAIEKRFFVTAIPIPCDGPYEYWDPQTLQGKGLISMKHAAVLAGLGTLGKNSLLINPQYGNLLTIGAILTSLTLVPDEPCAPLCIASCTKCIVACPVHAIDGGQVNQALCRPNSYGKAKRGFDTVECNLCRAVCPMGFGV